MNDDSTNVSTKSVGAMKENGDDKNVNENNSHTCKRARSDVDDNSDLEKNNTSYHNDLT